MAKRGREGTDDGRKRKEKGEEDIWTSQEVSESLTKELHPRNCPA